jgi:hypothetical protein
MKYIIEDILSLILIAFAVALAYWNWIMGGTVRGVNDTPTILCIDGHVNPAQAAEAPPGFCDGFGLQQGGSRGVKKEP